MPVEKTRRNAPSGAFVREQYHIHAEQTFVLVENAPLGTFLQICVPTIAVNNAWPKNTVSKNHITAVERSEVCRGGVPIGKNGRMQLPGADKGAVKSLTGITQGGGACRGSKCVICRGG